MATRAITAVVTAAVSTPVTALGNSDESANANKQAGRNADGAASATCPRCAVSFVCGVNAATCWCETLAVLDLTKHTEDVLGTSCLCEACLRATLGQSPAGASAA